MSERPGFMMYHDVFHALEELDDASFKRVLCAACQYSEDGEISMALSTVERVLFGMLKGKLDADWERYQRRVEAGRKGGMKSGEARRSNAKRTEATRSKMNDCEENRSNTKQNEANEPTITVPITVTPTITPTVTIGNSSNSSLSDGAGEERGIPTAEEVRKYAQLAGLEVDAEAFVTINTARGWTDSNGRPIRDWKLWLEYSPMVKRKEGGHEATAEPDRTGQRDEYGGLYL